MPPGGRRAVVGEFALASHHLQGASLEDADCTVCHDMSQHQQGYVRLKNVDDPGNPVLVVELTGDPAADPAEAAKLEAVCLACHDADGAGGSPPFSDGITPLSIDASAWAATAPGTAPTSASCWPPSMWLRHLQQTLRRRRASALPVTMPTARPPAM